jgi:phospholipase C
MGSCCSATPRQVGTRVPLIAVGPTVKRGFVDHTPYDFGSILRTIELRFGTEPVGEPDANAYPLRNLLQPAAPE